MKKVNWKPYIFWILVAELVGALSGFLTREGTRVFSEVVAKPALTPPAIVFPIVWGILYALMGISAGRMQQIPPSDDRSKGLNLFVAQLIVNFFWSLIFFNAQAYGFALLWLLLLLALVLRMTLTFKKADSLAAWIQVPYLVWLLFASYLNFGVWRLNG